MDKRTKGRGYTSPIMNRVFSSYFRYSWVEGYKASLARFSFRILFTYDLAGQVLRSSPVGRVTSFLSCWSSYFVPSFAGCSFALLRSVSYFGLEHPQAQSGLN